MKLREHPQVWPVRGITFTMVAMIALFAFGKTLKKAVEGAAKPNIAIPRVPPAGPGPDTWRTIGGKVHGIFYNPRSAVRTIKFSGYDWTVKSSQGRVGPGPNYFSDNNDNVWVDTQGRLHLRITQRNNRWYCAEVISKLSFGYGTYRFYLDSQIDNLDPNVVLGIFTWNDDPAYDHREIDIEFAKWGDKNNSSNTQFVVQPYTFPKHLLRFQVRSGTNTSTHSFTWKSDSIFFQSLKKHYAAPPNPSYVIKQWTCTQSIPQAGGENARMNLWLVGGSAPADNKETEIIIKKFEMTNLKPTREKPVAKGFRNDFSVTSIVAPTGTQAGSIASLQSE